MTSQNISQRAAVIIGCNGQDGSYLMELLLSLKESHSLEYHIIGMIRRASSFNTSRIDHIRKHPNVELVYGDLTDIGSIMNAINKAVLTADGVCSTSNKLEIYNLAAMSHVKVSFDIEKYSADVNAIGTLNVLQACKMLHLDDKVKVYQASTSEMYGNALVEHSLTTLTEESPMNPVSPYAIAKLYAYHLTKYYRTAYGMFAINGILQNHTSPRRGENFVCKKICDYVSRYNRDPTIEPLQLGNLDSTRDFGHSKDYVKGMWLMMQAAKPDDYVLATGRRTQIRTFVELAFKQINIRVRWEGEGVNEVGLDDHTNTIIVRVNPKYFRPYELTDLVGDSSKAQRELGWVPEYSLEQIIAEMIE
jgi:GDPmannose 4,6-dehydratase